ncbi:hypothetical protein [Prevotella sp. E13-27]|jgi:hypothetical protein|uniref:hypothetical protein n=1 Tax=Prevotella sp. E13-27 TaxID=2938122 RepID=UPI00200AEC80|nr:hypothetical protein [Prevotella sp. E13-27]MCK8621632.1 hypothetical protein [Prevotella sp. E13-27]
MKKYLREIEVSSMILMMIGVILYVVGKPSWATWVILIGIAIWVTEVIYKAFHWEAYRRDNTQNIIIMLVCTVTLFIVLLLNR